MTEICRTCLQEINDSSVIFCLNPKDSKSKAISIRCKLEYCLPELDLDIIPNAVICNNCFESLNLAHKFKNKCLETEGRIQSFIEKIGYVFAYIDLKKIAQQNNENIMIENRVTNDKQKNETNDNLDLRNLQCDTREFFAVPKIAQLLASSENNSSPDSFKCVHCGYTASNKPDLETHELIHLHKCNECDFSAPKRQSLIIHMRQHLKEKFSCSHCSYKTPYSTMLVEHNKAHTHNTSSTNCSEKSFKCRICNYKARLKLELKSHIKDHHKVYKCVTCGFSSSRKENFISHMKIHTHRSQQISNKNWTKTHTQTALECALMNNCMPFYCYKCGYNTACKSDLEEHMQSHVKSETMLNLHIKSNGNDYLKPNVSFLRPSSTDLKINDVTQVALESCIKNKILF